MTPSPPRSPKPPIPTGSCFAEPRLLASSPDATAWHLFPGLPEQRQKHNKQQHRTADSGQTFPSYFLPSSLCAFSPLPQGSCYRQKATTILFFSARSLRHPSRSKAPGAAGEELGKAVLDPESDAGVKALTCLLGRGCRRGLRGPSQRRCAAPKPPRPSAVNRSSQSATLFPRAVGMSRPRGWGAPSMTPTFTSASVQQHDLEGLRGSAPFSTGQGGCEHPPG